jgi:anti-sigma factor RsiW
MTEQHWTAEDIERFADGEARLPDEHLRECAQCANAVVAATQMKRAVRAAMDVGPAPQKLRNNILARKRAAWQWLAVAAGITAIVMTTLFVRLQSQPPALPELVDMHVTMLASANPVDVISTDRHTVKPWFEGRVPFAVAVPELTSTPFRLIGGRVVYWHGHQAAYLLVGKNAHRISLFAFRSEDAPRNLGAAPPTVSCLAWQDHGLTFVAVADVPQTDLARLRQLFSQQ